MSRYVSLFFVVLLFLSCSTPHSIVARLESSEVLLAENPDSALRIIRSINRSKVRGDSRKAQYALLYSRALDKNFIDVKDDSLARVAVDYYSQKGSAEQQATAYYYLGRVYENAGDIEECIINLTLASECVPEENYYLRGLIYSHLGELHRNQYNSEESNRLMEISAEAFKQAGAKLNESTVYDNLSLNYKILQDYARAESYKLKSLDLRKELGDTIGILACSKELENIKYHNDTSRDVITNIFAIYKEYNDGEIPINDYYLLSTLYAAKGDVDSVNLYLDLYLTTTNASLHRDIVVNRVKYELAKKTRSIDEIIQLAAENEVQISQLNNEDKQHQIEVVIEKYKSQLYKTSFNEEKQKNKISIIIVGLLSLLLIAAVGVIYFTYRYVVLKRLNEQRQQEVILFDQQEHIATLEEAQYSLHKQYKSLLSEIESNDEVEVKAINKIEETVCHINNLLESVSIKSKKPDKALATFVDAMSTTANDNAAYFHLRYIANKKYFGIINFLEKNYQLTHFEIDLCSMICLNFSNDAIRILLGHDNNRSIYNKRSKLKSSLGIEGNKHIEDFIKEKIEILSKGGAD